MGGKPSSVNRERIHKNSEVALVMALYSLSVEDRATVGYFLESQAMRLEPIKSQSGHLDHRPKDYQYSTLYP